MGLAGRAFVCMRMPLRATDSTQVLFASPSVPDGDATNKNDTARGCRFFVGGGGGN